MYCLYAYVLLYSCLCSYDYAGYRMAPWGFAMVFLMATLRLSESHKDGQHRPGTVEETKRFGLPEDVIVIADWDSAGVQEGSLPKDVAGMMCDALKSARKCMNVSEFEPIYYGR